jgi:choline dehydrogenase-like flavoprotein
MGLDSRAGVVDPQGRVFGLENLYLAGASIFPTAGYANPTLTVVATALRLASHVDAALG